MTSGSLPSIPEKDRSPACRCWQVGGPVSVLESIAISVLGGVAKEQGRTQDGKEMSQ